uniref:Leucine-rich repeat-containing N-terminal plant-type domain-containing protein n=1 Tax=Oryza barthii TaxID=65489 RepID=A0A0D3F2Q0_9ORYZ
MVVYSILILFLLSLIFSISNSQSAAQPSADEQTLLLAIKQDWDNPAPLSSWSSTGNWTGVISTSTGHWPLLAKSPYSQTNPSLRL